MAHVYLDSTIPSFLFDDRENSRLFIDITKDWWQNERKKYDIFISEETIAELTSGSYPKKKEIVELISTISVLPPNPDILKIAQVYLDNYLMPRKLEGDALHLAYASYYKIEFLLTWNCNHLANANKKQHIRIINTRLNLPIPEIITPMELFEEEKNVEK